MSKILLTWIKRTIFVLVVLNTTGAGCRCDQQFLASELEAEYEDDGTRTNKALRLITPEQFVQNVASTLRYNDQAKLDDIIQRHAVALGGVDFQSAHKRNRTPTGQAQLTIRRLAWDIAEEVVNREASLQSSGEKAETFEFSTIAVDRPRVPSDYLQPPEIQLAIKEGEERYQKQIDKLYWLLLSRPPSPAELDLHANTFLKFMELEDSATDAWTASLYIILASMEYWNI